MWRPPLSICRPPRSDGRRGIADRRRSQTVSPTAASMEPHPARRGQALSAPISHLALASRYPLVCTHWSTVRGPTHAPAGQSVQVKCIKCITLTSRTVKGPIFANVFCLAASKSKISCNLLEFDFKSLGSLHVVGVDPVGSTWKNAAILRLNNCFCFSLFVLSPFWFFHAVDTWWWFVRRV